MSARVEVWHATGNRPGEAAAMARDAETAGFDGLSFGDTQCLSPDPYVGLAVAAGATTALKLGIRVTNPVTRHPSVTACAAATLQVESGGRTVLGIGRGDSSLAHIGAPAATVAQLEKYVVALQGYLVGDAVDATSALCWLPPVPVPKVPVDVAATGPGVIAAGARHAEMVTFNVGADPARVRRAVDLARGAREQAGGDPATLSLGAYVNLVSHVDRRVALDLVKGPLAAYAHFSGMPGHPLVELDPDDARIIVELTDRYDSSQHARSGASHVDALDDSFIERFAVTGSPARCVEKLATLVTLGLDRLVLVGAAPDAPLEQVAESRQLLVEEVLPGLHRAVGR